MRFRRALWSAGLGLLAGAILHGSAEAQGGGSRDTTRTRRDTIPPARADTIPPRRDTIPPPRRDTTTRRDTVVVPVPPPADTTAADSLRAAQHADSIARADSLGRLAAARARAAADTIKAPLARGELPVTPDITSSYRWNRAELFSTGALNLADLVALVPGITMYRGGWLLEPQVSTYFGEFRTIRVFRDGVELDPLDLRTGGDRTRGGMVDLSFIPIWALEEVVIEQGAQEVRVYLRSWRVQRTTPYTRVDVSTGDLETNSYRGYFGKRTKQGLALQLGANQLSTTDPRIGGDGDQLSAFGRLGWAKNRWSVDAVYEQVHRSRNVTLDRTGAAILAGTDATRADAYLRAAYGDPDGGRWLQLIAATMRFSETAPKTSSALGGTTAQPVAGLPVDTADTSSSRVQYVLTGGVTRGGFRASAAARYRVYEHQSFLSPSARLGYDRGWLSASLFAERRSEEELTRGDAVVRVSPFSFLSLWGAYSHASPSGSNAPVTNALRGEAGIRLGRLWFTGGVMRRDSALIVPPVVFDTAFKPVREGGTTMGLASIRGALWKDVFVDVHGTVADKGRFYVPQYQVLSQLFLDSSWLTRFPSGNFHIKAGVSHEYRSKVLFPISATQSFVSTEFRSITTLLEIRLLDAVLFYQFRNILGEIYQTVPGFDMPRQTQVYGVRWEFFN